MGHEAREESARGMSVSLHSCLVIPLFLITREQTLLLQFSHGTHQIEAHDSKIVYLESLDAHCRRAQHDIAVTLACGVCLRAQRLLPTKRYAAETERDIAQALLACAAREASRLTPGLASRAFKRPAGPGSNVVLAD